MKVRFLDGPLAGTEILVVGIRAKLLTPLSGTCAEGGGLRADGPFELGYEVYRFVEAEERQGEWFADYAHCPDESASVRDRR